MGSSEGNERPWVPYMNTKDCSQGFCSYYCPHWCYLFPPPPPFDNSPGPNFSPLVIAIIGILASAFLLLSYYAIISKYCKNRESSSRIENYPVLESEENHQEPGNHEPWHVPTNGLDESLIKSITMFKYKKGDGSIEGTYCSVCLSEFQEDESLRLLPKCNHAFHSMCIDTWLKSHSNCPLCRANIILISSLPPVSESHPPPPLPLRIPNESRFQNSPDNENVAFEEDIETGIRERDSETSETRGGEGEHIRRRSVSMDDSFPGRLSIADILQINDEDGDQNEEHRFPEDVGESKRAGEEMSRSNNRSRILLCVTSPTAMKRSFSSGRFLSSKRARGRNIVLPL